MNLRKLGLVVEGVLVVGSAVVAVLSALQVKKVSESVDIAVKNLANSSAIEIEDTIVEKAITEAVDKKVEDIKRDVYNQVLNQSLEKGFTWMDGQYSRLYSELEAGMTSKMRNELKQIDQEKLKKELVKDAKKSIMEKFDGELDGLMAEHSRNLENMSKIYKSIADKMDPTANAAKSVNLNIG